MPEQSSVHLLWKHVRTLRVQLAWAFVWRLMYVLVPLQIPLLTGAILDALAGNPVTLYGLTFPGAGPWQVVAGASAALLLLALIYGLSSYARIVSSAVLSRKIVVALRKTLFRMATSMSSAHRRQLGDGEMLSRILNDTAGVRSFISRVFIQTPINLLRLIYPITMLFLIDTLLAVIALAALLPQSVASYFLQLRLQEASRTRRRTRARLTEAVKEMLDETETLRGLGTEARMHRQLDDKAESLEQDEMRSSRLSGAMNAVVWSMSGSALALTWWIGGMQVMNGDMTVGTLVAFTGFVALAYQPFRRMTAMQRTYRTGTVALERIDELLQGDVEARESPEAQPFSFREGEIEVRELAFCYLDYVALQAIRLRIPGRKLTVIAGPNGAGKSTLLRLLARTSVPDSGSIAIDGRPIADIARASFQAQVMLIPQRPSMFAGTLRDNLTLACPQASTEEIQAACRAVQADALIAQLPHGLDTRVGPGGVEFSAGQEKRIALARALLAKPRILLVDDPLTGLDPEARVRVAATLRELSQDHTVVVTATDADAVRDADCMVYLGAGRVVFIQSSSPAERSSTERSGLAPWDGGLDARLLQPKSRLAVPSFIREVEHHVSSSDG